MLSVIDYLRARVAPDDALLQALLEQQAEMRAGENAGSANPNDIWAMAERCGLVDPRTYVAPHVRSFT